MSSHVVGYLSGSRWDGQRVLCHGVPYRLQGPCCGFIMEPHWLREPWWVDALRESDGQPITLNLRFCPVAHPFFNRPLWARALSTRELSYRFMRDYLWREFGFAAPAAEVFELCSYGVRASQAPLWYGLRREEWDGEASSLAEFVLFRRTAVEEEELCQL